MKNTFINIEIIAALLFLLAAQSSNLQAQGALTPPGEPAPTMKTLAQIEPRTAITNTSVGMTISQPGSYYLTTNLTVTSGDAIIIAANNVTLDLNGFMLSSTSAAASGTAIGFNTSQTNVTILNGFIHSGITNNGSNIYGGSGWARGIFSSYPVYNVRVSGVAIHGCSLHGIYLGIGTPTFVKNCTVNNIGWGGIFADVVLDSTANVGGYGGNAGIQANLIINCRGASYAGPGVYALQVAGNCTGTSTSGYGVNATVADTCSGTSTSQIGLLASVVNNSTGISTSARGLSTVIGKNSFGSSSTFGSYGFYAVSLATGCYGGNAATPGIGGNILNSCAGTDVSASVRYNMP